MQEFLLPFDEYDDDHIVSDEFYKIRKTQCRACRKKIKPWQGVYYRVETSHCYTVKIGFSAENFYCESCAQKKAELKKANLPAPVSEYEHGSGNNRVLVREFSDGSVEISDPNRIKGE